MAGWTFSDLTWAIDHEPGGRQHRQRLANVRHPAGWLRWRLAHWRSPDGSPLPSRTAQLAAAAAAHRADRARRRETDPVTAARADQLRQAAAAAAVLEDQADTGRAPAGQLLAALRARLGAALGPRWRDPAELAAQQAAEARAARAARAAAGPP